MIDHFYSFYQFPVRVTTTTIVTNGWKLKLTKRNSCHLPNVSDNTSQLHRQFRNKIRSEFDWNSTPNPTLCFKQKASFFNKIILLISPYTKKGPRFRYRPRFKPSLHKPHPHHPNPQKLAPVYQVLYCLLPL